MNKRMFLTLLTMIMCIGLVSNVTKNGIGKVKEEANSETRNDVPVKQLAQYTADSLTVGDVARYLETRNEHYPLSDEFVEKYQQKSGGYIDNAKKAGLVVDKQLHEPNQKWHFFDSWIAVSLQDGTLTPELTANARSRIYTSLQCPELMLWIYEACQVSPAKVSAAKKLAEAGKVAGKSTSTIAKEMRGVISWDETAAAVIEYLEGNPESNIYTASVASGSGFEVNGLNTQYSYGDEVTFTVNVTDSTKTIDKVKYNNTVLSPVSDGNYKFTMPRSNVTITVILKDIQSGNNPGGDDSGDVGDPITTNAKYNLKFDLGNKTSQVRIEDNTKLMNMFELTSSENIIESASIVEETAIYGGGHGGSGETRWYAEDLLKIGGTSLNGGIILNLNTEVSSVIITGYIHKDSCKVRIGDSSSLDWTTPGSDNLTKLHDIKSTSMNVASKEVVGNNQTSTITLDFTSTKTLRIDTTNSKPLYITSIEFVLTSNAV